ncbi:MAG: iron-sulfur cluster repair di-iron protein [Candidatus Acidiferrales bacterium]
MNLSENTKVRDVAVSNSNARKILEQAGMDYCCGGDKSLRDACIQSDTSSDTSLDEIMERLRTTDEPLSQKDAEWTLAPLHELTRHIVNRHHAYVREAIQHIEPLLEKVKAKHGQRHPEIAEIEALFSQTAEEMIAHMQKEEQILFPYINALALSAAEKRAVEPPFFRSVRNPIRTMMKEHDSAGELTKQIRRESFGYTAPADACASFQALYRELGEFEADLHEHVHLENNILFPRAIELESAPH